MRFLLLSALLAVVLSQPNRISDQDLSEWELFKIEHEREYESDAEEMKRKEIFIKNLHFIQEHNAKFEKGEVTFDMAMNHFGDKTPEEVAVTRGYNIPEGLLRTGEPFDDSDDVEMPRTKDWRKTGAVTGVKDQGLTCGSCWAFSTTGSLEGQHYLKNKKLVSLSEQNLVDCSKNGGNKGCNGGTMDAAFTYIKENKGIDTEKSYPYEGEDDRCRYKSNKKGATCKGHVDITQYSEKALQKAVAKIGPISIAIDANHTSFTYYNSGVYTEPACSTTKLDHGVLAVGYGTAKKGGAYWLVKNSWGSGWGMKGYVMMKRNHHNQCGIATAASYPKV